MRISIGPSSLRKRSAASLTAFASRTSALAKTALTLRVSSTISLSRSSRRANKPRFPPRAAISSAIPLPSPEEAPVIITTLLVQYPNGLDQYDNRRDHRPGAGLLLNKPLQLHSHMLFQKRLIFQRLPRRSGNRRRHDTLRILEHSRPSRKTILSTQPADATRDDLRLTIKLASLFIDRHDNRHGA